ncbi:MAG: LCP family protein [Chthonomonadales bacterium]
MAEDELEEHHIEQVGAPSTPRFSSELGIKKGLTRWQKFGRAFGTLACIGSVGVGFVFGTFFWQSGTFRNLILGHGFSAGFNFITKGDATADWMPDRQFRDRTSMNVLILGCDHDYDNKDQIVRNTWGRSDSIMLARFDFIGKRVDAITIPRDTAVHIPGYRTYHKINAAHSYGGPTLTAETIEQTFGVKVDAVVEINFEGFQQIVDTIGGIDVKVDKKLDYDDNWGNLHIHLLPGEQHMDGYKAMGYVRVRHSDSDEMRSKRQHNFIEAMRTKIKSPGTFTSLPAAVDRLSDNLKHYELSQDQMFTLVNFARTLPKESINIETLPSFEGKSYVTLDNVKSAKVIERIFFPNTQTALNINTPDPEGMRDGGRPIKRRRRRAAEPASLKTGGTKTNKAPVDGPPTDTSKPPVDTMPPPPDNGPIVPPTDAGTRPG